MGRLVDAYKLDEIRDIINYSSYPMNYIDNAPTVDAIPRADYEKRLKADLKAILVDLQLEIEELETYDIERTHGLIENGYISKEVENLIQQKINSIKEIKDGGNSN